MFVDHQSLCLPIMCPILWLSCVVAKLKVALLTGWRAGERSDGRTVGRTNRPQCPPVITSSPAIAGIHYRAVTMPILMMIIVATVTVAYLSYYYIMITTEPLLFAQIFGHWLRHGRTGLVYICTWMTGDGAHAQRDDVPMETYASIFYRSVMEG